MVLPPIDSIVQEMLKAYQIVEKYIQDKNSLQNRGYSSGDGSSFEVAMIRRSFGQLMDEMYSSLPANQDPFLALELLCPEVPSMRNYLDLLYQKAKCLKPPYSKRLTQEEVALVRQGRISEVRSFK